MNIKFPVLGIVTLLMVVLPLNGAPAPLVKRHQEKQLRLEGTWDEIGGRWRIVTFWPGGRYESYRGNFSGQDRWVGFWELSGRRLTVKEHPTGDTWWEGEGYEWSVELDRNLSGIKEWPGGTRGTGVYRLCKP